MDTTGDVQVDALNSPQDIVSLVRRLTPQAIESGSIVVTIKYVYEPAKLLLVGFLPYELSERNKKIIALWLQDMHKKGGTPLDRQDLNFWSMHSGAASNLQRVLQSNLWVFKTLDGHKKSALKHAGDLGLFLSAPRELYSSHRPKTAMSLFRTTFSPTVQRHQIMQGVNGWQFYVTPQQDLRYLLPVTRYSKGMSRGLYYGGDDSGKEYCGTFFYYEPESTTFLSYTTRADYFNKSVCALSFQSHNTQNRELYAPNIAKHVFGDWPADMMMTPLQAYDYKLYNLRIMMQNAEELTPGQGRLSFANDLSQTPRYAGMLSGLYALEDDYDQEICVAGKRRGIDVIVLTHMIGSRQVVTEVLDTRSRQDCMASLVYLEE